MRAFEESWQNTDLVLLDMIMPDMGGATTFHALRAIDPAASIVLTSGYSITEEAKRLVDDGASAFLVKPVSPSELVQTLSAVLASRGRADK